MKLEEMEKMLEDSLSYSHNLVYRFNDDTRKVQALNSLSNAVQALLMVRQEMDRQKACKAEYEAERVDPELILTYDSVKSGDIIENFNEKFIVTSIIITSESKTRVCLRSLKTGVSVVVDDVSEYKKVY